ncbi:MAG: glycosyltransferase [Candidatus Kerfeldbacteria bacterium]|nr:glycosyltransferase [Candidatus Kerfeldbacteria bacterium]
MTRTLIMMNMTYNHLWKQGMVNRNFHMLRQLQTSNVFERIVSVDVLPISRSKVLRVALSSRPWRKNMHTQMRGASYRIDSDPVNSNTSYVTAYGMRSVQRALKTLNVDIHESIVWSYDPLSAEAILDLKPKAFIFDAVDNWMEHPAYTQYTDRLAEAYRTITERADIIFTVSEGLLDIFERRSNVFFVPNGVDYEHFAATDSTLQSFIGEHERPVIGYHGVIQSRMNFSLLDYIIDKHPEYDFHFVGPVWKDAKDDVKRLCKKKNVRFLGSVPYLKLPETLHTFDCAIIPHKIDAFTHSMNPLKLYEYLAAGVPIVATPVAGVDQFQDLVHFAVSPEDFSREIQQALSTESSTLRKRRMSMAQHHAWSKRFDVVRTILKNADIL